MGGGESLSMGLIFGLGLFHGINPGMGWLFAVALGLQERRPAAVWMALAPLALGHALAVAAAAAIASLAGLAVSPALLKWMAGAGLITLGISRLARHRHPRFGGMRVGAAGLAAWSFAMATAHGAGLMVVPLLIGETSWRVAAAGGHAHHAPLPAQAVSAVQGLQASLVHGAGYLLATGIVAWLVYERLGVGVLRRAWINLDVIWAVALMATGAMTALW